MAHILVVDDDPDLRTILKTLLIQSGHSVDESAGGREALSKMLKNAPDICVLDVMMPSVDGFTVLKEMRSKGLKKSVKVLLLTAKTSETDWVKGYRLGADLYLTKPFDPDEIIDAIEMLEQRAPSELQARREKELEKAELLSRVESIFDRF
jgi:DNA-binding response OmpR family regulator